MLAKMIAGKGAGFIFPSSKPENQMGKNPREQIVTWNRQEFHQSPQHISKGSGRVCRKRTKRDTFISNSTNSAMHNKEILP